MNLVSTLLRCAAPCLLLAACAAPEAPSSQVPFGATARAAFARQAISLPSAAPVTGLDGAAALQAQQGYRKSFAEREPALRPQILSVGAQK